MTMISDLIKEQIKSLIISDSIESCGLVIHNQVVSLPNSHSDPVDNFAIASKDLAKFNYSQIKAFWHTHCSDTQPGYFTYTDIEMSRQTQKPIILYHMVFDVWDYYEPNNPNPFPLNFINYTPKQIEFYQGIPFYWGRSDCFSIGRCYFLGMLGVDVGDFQRSHLDNFPPENYDCPFDFNHQLQLMPIGTKAKVHDVFAIALRGGLQVNHAAILVDAEKNLILHSMSQKSLSKIEPYNRYLRERTISHYRLKCLC
jgi:hypothetical protein